MVSKTLKNKIAQGEGYYTEFKRNVNSDLKKEFVAFANASGGNIFLGIEDDGTICGIQNNNQLISKIQEFANECDPPFEIQIEALSDNVLQSLGAIKIENNKPLFTNVGLLIFTDSPAAFLHQAYISCVAFRTSEKVDIVDRKDFQGDFFTNIERALSFVERHINVAAKIEDTIREDVWEVPKVALRESIVNAVVHRDYLETGARVVVEVFPDKIVVSNPGGLPKGMPAKDFGKYSLARNAFLSNIMQRAGYIEKLGTGITRIKQEVEKAGLPEPIFHYNYFFAVEFTRADKIKKSSEKILQIISDNKFISARELAQELNISQRAIEKNLAILKNEGKLKRIGPAKGGHWEITKNNL